MELFIYAMVVVIVIADVWVAQYINGKRKALDPNEADYAQREKGHRIVIASVLFYSFVVAALLLFYVKPMLAG